MSLEDRVTRIESCFRWSVLYMSLYMLTALATFAVAAFIAFQTSGYGVIDELAVRRLVVKDAMENSVVLLSATPDGSPQLFMERRGNGAVMLDVSESGPGVNLWADELHPLVVLSSTQKDRGSIRTYNHNGDVCAIMTADSTGNGHVEAISISADDQRPGDVGDLDELAAANGDEPASPHH